MIGTNEPIKIAKTKCGKLVKLYDDGADWIIHTIGHGIKYPELWKTKHSGRNAERAVLLALYDNELELLEFIK